MENRVPISFVWQHRHEFYGSRIGARTQTGREHGGGASSGSHGDVTFHRDDSFSAQSLAATVLLVDLVEALLMRQHCSCTKTVRAVKGVIFSFFE